MQVSRPPLDNEETTSTVLLSYVRVANPIHLLIEVKDMIERRRYNSNGC